MNKTFPDRLMLVLRVIVLTVAILVVTMPIYWIVITSLKTNAEVINTAQLTFYPHKLTLQNYKDMFTQLNFGLYLKNSLYLSLLSSMLVTVISILGGYGLSRYSFKSKKMIMLFVLVTQMIPSILILIPMYSVFAKMKIISRAPHIALFCYYVVANIPFCLLTMKSFFENIPYALEEAAMIDGCSRIDCMVKIVIPIMLPSIMAVFCFAFIGAWNELMAGIIFTSQPSSWTIPVGLKSLINKLGVPWGTLMAGGTMALLPTGVMFFIAQKYIVSGLTAGAVKE